MKTRKNILFLYYALIALLSAVWVVINLLSVNDFAYVFVYLAMIGFSILLGIFIFLIALVFYHYKKILLVDLISMPLIFMICFCAINFSNWESWYLRFSSPTIEDYKEAITHLDDGKGFDDSCNTNLCYDGNSVLIDGEMVAFVTEPGIIDNWTGVVYDPTELIDNGIESGYSINNWNDSQFNNLRKIFGGDLTGCDKIEQSWYSCSFT